MKYTLLLHTLNKYNYYNRELFLIYAVYERIN